MQTLAERLIWARKKAGLSQQELADAVGASQSLIGNLEAGTRKSSAKIAALAARLGVSAIWLAECRGSPMPDADEKEESAASAPSVATARILNILNGRPEEEIARIAGALDVLLHAGKLAAADVPEEFRLSGGAPAPAQRRKA